jgi:CHRD domain
MLLSPQRLITYFYPLLLSRCKYIGIQHYSIGTVNPLIFPEGMTRGWQLLKYYLGCQEVMFEKIVVGMIAVVIIASTAITVLTDSEVFAQEQKFTAQLSGQEEVPPTNSQATGMGEGTVVGQSIEWTLNASNIQGVTAGHVHAGKQGENGPIVVTLFKYDPPMNEVSESGTITADKLEGPMAGKQISDLVTAGANGTLYVNIHTEQNPNGEIRGQVTPSSTGGQ